MRGLEGRSGEIAAAIEITLDAAPREMQHAVDAALIQRRPHGRRKFFSLGGPVDHHGANGEARHRQFTGSILAGEIKQRQPRAGKPLRRESREVIGVAVGRCYFGEAYGPCRLCAAAAHRQHRQSQQLPALRMIGERTRADPSQGPNWSEIRFVG